MDENYLDNLLNEISLDNEIDDTMNQSDRQNRKVDLKQDTFDDVMTKDSRTTLYASDDIFGESQFDELDELDRMANIDMSDLNFDDLDFDDLDFMNLDKPQEAAVKKTVHAVNTDRSISEEDGLSIDGSFFGSEQQTAFVPEEIPETNMNHDASDVSSSHVDAMDMMDAFSSAEQVSDEPQQTEATGEVEDFFQQLEGAQVGSATEEAPDGGAGTEVDMDALSFLFGSEGSDDVADQDNSSEAALDTSTTGNADSGSSDTNMDSSDDMADLFAMLGIEESDLQDSSGGSSGEVPMYDELPEEDNAIADIDKLLDTSIEEADNTKTSAKGKKSLADIMFGTDEDADDDISEEELAAIRAAKKAKKDAKKSEKQAKAEEKAKEKAAKDAAAKADKAAKNAVKVAKRKSELENEPPEKKLNKPMVGLIFTILLVFAIIVVIGTEFFNYELVIKKAADYFERQKYHMAYEEIIGVEVKEEDQELESKIYTVMYVERLYESYETNMSLNRPVKALDSLLRGLEKYDEHYDTAVELNIVSDINYSRGKIISALQSTYGISESEAYEILDLDSYAYRKKLDEYALSDTTEE